jgi:hypothetical protein
VRSGLAPALSWLGQRLPALNAEAGARRWRRGGTHRCVWAALALPICQFLFGFVISSGRRLVGQLIFATAPRASFERSLGGMLASGR